MNKTKLIVTIAMIGIIAWLVDVFGRTMIPAHPQKEAHILPCVFGRTMQPDCVEYTWNGYVVVHKRSEPVATLHW